MAIPSFSFVSKRLFHAWIFGLLCRLCLTSISGGKFSQDERKFQKEAVKTHNTFRAIHHSPGLKLDLNLTLEAKKLADEASKRQGFVNLTAGENIFEQTSTNYQDAGGKEVTEKW